MMDLINPWGALRRMRILNIALLDEVEYMEREAEDDYLAYKEICQRFETAEALIAEGHFRNPKTGRLGRKGETFDA